MRYVRDEFWPGNNGNNGAADGGVVESVDGAGRWVGRKLRGTQGWLSVETIDKQIVNEIYNE